MHRRAGGSLNALQLLPFTLVVVVVLLLLQIGGCVRERGGPGS